LSIRVIPFDFVRPVLVGVLVAGCQSDGGSLAPSNAPVTFTVANSLIAPVTILIDGAPYALLDRGASSSLTVSSRSEWLVWTSAKPKDANGVLIPDDIGEIRVSLAGINRTLEIANVIQDQPYITAGVFNDTDVPVSIGVFNGSTVECAGALPAAANGKTGFVQIGYYRLSTTTEVRAYHDPLHCTGSYVYWPSSVLVSFAPKTGLLSLIMESAP
jgi:hypothetical protein